MQVHVSQKGRFQRCAMDATDTPMTASRTLRVRSVLNSLLWLTAVATPVFFGAAVALRDDLLIARALIGVGSLPMLSVLGWFGYFALRRPEMLQSEDFQLRHEAMQLSQGRNDPQMVPRSAVALPNPGARVLPAGSTT